MEKTMKNKMVALEWCAVFLFMNQDPRIQKRSSTDEFWWYKYCTDQANRYPMNSVEHIFWWSLRMGITAGVDQKDSAWLQWRKYLNWKLHQSKIGAVFETEEM